MNQALYKPELALGCWKAPLDTSCVFVESLVKAGLVKWDIGRNYQFFGNNYERLAFKRYSFDRNQIKLHYKIGASLVMNGFTVHEPLIWDAEIDRFLSCTGAQFIDVVILCCFPRFDQIDAVLRWIFQKIDCGIFSYWGVSNVTPLQFELLRIASERIAPIYNGLLVAVQQRCSPLIVEEMECINQFSGMGIDIQAYGLLHSGLLLNKNTSTIPWYVEEYKLITKKASDYIAGKSRQEIIAASMVVPIKAGASTVIVAPRTLHNLEEILEAICSL